MTRSRESLISRAGSDFQRILDEVGEEVVLRTQGYSVGSIYGERINGTPSGTTVTAEIQTLDHRFIMDSAGKWEESDRMAFFKPTDLSTSAIVDSSGGSIFFVNHPSGGSAWYKVQEAFTEDMGAGSPIFTEVILKLVESGAL